MKTGRFKIQARNISLIYATLSKCVLWVSRINRNWFLFYVTASSFPFFVTSPPNFSLQAAASK